MRRFVKWAGIGLGGLVVLVVSAGLTLLILGDRKFKRTYDLAVEPVAIPADAESLARGQHLVEAVSGCTGCHQPDLGGEYLINEPDMAVVAAPNLTRGQGGVGAHFSDQDWVRAIRHGVGGDGRGLVGMPSPAYTYFSDADLGAIIAYLKTVPPVDRSFPACQAAPMARALLALGALPLAPELIDHQARRDSPAQGPTASYGEYLVDVAACRDCHGPDLNGGTDPNDPPPGPNLTPGGALSVWTEADFLAALRTGQRPGGDRLSDDMPWETYRAMTDEELTAIWRYLESLPTRETAAR